MIDASYGIGAFRNPRTRVRAALPLIALMMGLAPCGFGQTSDGAGTLFGAHLQTPLVSLSEGTNGLLELTGKVALLGGCCFPLTSHHVTATLTVPDGVQIVGGPDPMEYPALEAPPSGTPKVCATFRWQLRRTAEVAGEIVVNVSSPDSGRVRATYALDEKKRINVSGPQLPEKLYVGQKLALVVDASCVNDNRYLTRVCFWHSDEIPRGATDIELAPGLEARGVLRFKEGARQLMVQGAPLDLTRKYEPTLWRGELAMPTNGVLCGVAVATDDAGHTAGGNVVRAAVPKTRHAALGPTGGASFARLPRRALAVLGLALAVALAAALRRSAAIAAAAVLVGIGAAALCVVPPKPRGPAAETPGCPAEGSVVVFLFLDSGDASRRLAGQMERYRSAAPHRIHVLCFAEGATPPDILATYRGKYRVARMPSAVFDGRFCVDGTNEVALTGTLDRCMNKPSPRLSMELQGGVVAGRDLSLGFILCSHVLPSDVRGSFQAFACESDVAVGGWRCDRVVRHVLEAGKTYVVPARKCVPPFLFGWTLPKDVRSEKTGALILILNEQGEVVDAVCTEKPCGRTGICG